MEKNKKIILYSALLIVGSYFLFLGLAKARDILAPLATAGILVLLVLPWANKLEAKMKKAYSSLLHTFILFLISLLFLGVIFFQVKTFADDWPKIKETMKPKIEQLKNYVAENTPLSKNEVEEQAQSSGNSSESGNGEQLITVLNQVMGFFGSYLLTFVYIFFLLNYRKRFKEFILRLFPDEKKEVVKNAIQESATVVQQYLVGKFILIGLLSVLYAIGLGVSGVNNFIIISLLAALLTLIPYVGNIIGFAMAMSFGYLTSGETGVLIGIVITFSITQFIESYVLEPYVVGDKVDVHPFFVIVGIIIGNALWRVIGMILAIPILAIITIILLHVPPLHPFGFLLSNKPTSI